ncbi:MAG: dTMP kinase [Micropruina sp.]|nr:dTMP kinase [Micropruina sp.]
MTGIFVVFEGGDGVGKGTQAALLVQWLRESGREVVLTFEPGDTPVGRQLRHLVLDHSTGDLDPRAEALLYAADKAQHVYEVVRPALARGAVVVCDRYVDSLVAYQGAGRVLTVEDIGWLGWWSVAGLRPQLTIVLDMDPRGAVGEIAEKDRVESAGEEFHRRARQGFLDFAAADPEHYLVLPARDSIEELATAIRTRVNSLLSDPPDRL